MRIGYYQFRPLFGKVEKNLSKVLTALEGIEAEIIVLPELAFTGYYFEDRQEAYDLADDVTSSFIINDLTELCRENDFHIVTGFTERFLDKCYNSAVLVGPDGLEHTYRKLHLFNEEKNIFDMGDKPLQIHHVRGVNIGIMVCFDWAFPEVSRTLTLQGADIICHPSNLVLTFCQETMLSRCLENRVYAVTANRYGTDSRPQGDLKFTGKSQVVAPGGELLHRAASQKDEIFIVDVDIEKARDKSITALNDLIGDRRPEFYKSLAE